VPKAILETSSPLLPKIVVCMRPSHHKHRINALCPRSIPAHRDTRNRVAHFPSPRTYSAACPGPEQ
jgi:hypothetical protein